MLIARVIGTLVASRKHERLVGSRIQIVQPLDPRSQTAQGDPLVAVDAVGAGVGELVMVVRGSSARRGVGLMNNARSMRPLSVSLITSIFQSSRGHYQTLSRI